MSRCRMSPHRKRFGVGEVGGLAKRKRRKGYLFRRYSRGNKGHSWKGHGKDRSCVRCGYKPKNR